MELIQLIINQIKRFLILRFKEPWENLAKKAHRELRVPPKQDMCEKKKQSKGHDEAVVRSRVQADGGHSTTQTNETHREDMNNCASSHTFHFLVSSALGT